MSGDRSRLRSFYPSILEFTEGCAFRMISDGISASEVEAILGDVQAIKRGWAAIPWPEEETIQLTRTITRNICLVRFAQISDIPQTRDRLADVLHQLGVTKREWEDVLRDVPPRLDDQFSCDSVHDIPEDIRRMGVARMLLVGPPTRLTETDLRCLESTNKNWREVFLETPARRLAASLRWNTPFDAINRDLGEEFPTPDDCQVHMEIQVFQGHSWFGVGEWNVANLRYLLALSAALSNNDDLAVEIIVRFLVDTYTASGDFHSAARVAKDYLSSVAHDQYSTEVPRQMLESVAAAFALAGRWTECKEWIDAIPTTLGTGPQTAVGKWNIIELLQDVHSFRGNHQVLARIDSAVARLVNYVGQR